MCNIFFKHLKKYLLFIITVCVLSSCGVGGCVLKEDSQFDKHELRICTNPHPDVAQCQDCECGDVNCINCSKCVSCNRPENFNIINNKTYWIKSSISVKNGGSTTLVINPSDNIDVCHGGCPNSCSTSGVVGSCDTAFCKVAEVKVRNTSGTLIDMEFKQGDTISFSLYPYLDLAKIDSDICDGKNPNVYAGSECRDKHLGKYYYSMIGDPRDASGNVKDDPSNNVVFNTGFRWFSGAALYSTETNAVLKDYCNGDPNCQLICGILDTNKIEDVDKIKDIKKRIDLLTLNQLCSNIRMYTYLYDNNTGQVIGSNLVGSNNFTSITVPVDASGTPTLNSYMYGSYLPMLRVSLFGFSQVLAIQTEKVANVDCTKLNFPFEVGNVNSSTYNIVRLYLDDNNQQSNRGGYKIKISKKCKGDTEKILYLYVGNDPPDFKPGEGDSVLVDNIDLFKKNNTFNIPSNKSGNVYFGIKDIKNNNYADNIGYFTLEASTSKQAKPILSNAIRSVRNQILRIMYGHNVVSDDGTISNNISENDGSGAVGTVYKGIIGSTFKNTIQALILLYITVYSILFLIGAFKAPQLEFVVLLLKIGVVAILLSDNSWRFFNETLFSLFIDGTTELINIMSGPAIETTSSDGKVQSVVDFYFLDRLLGKFAIGQTWLQIFSLLFAGPVGWLIMLAIFWGLWELLCAVFNATINYFMSIIMVALLICLAPIFISLIFFKRTKSIFDSWIKNLAQVATLPSIIFAALALISNAMDGILYTLFNFDICPGCVIEPKIDLSIDTFSFCLLEVLLPLGFSPLNTVHDNIGSTYDGVGFMGIPISLAALIAFVILGHSLSAFVQHGTNIAMNIFGAFGANLSQTAGQFNDSIQTIFGKDRASQGQKMSQEHSKGLDKAKEPPKSVQRD